MQENNSGCFLTQCTWYSVHDLCKDFRDKRTLDFRENENNYIDFVKIIIIINYDLIIIIYNTTI